MQTLITNQINNYEPRAQLQSVTASPLYDKNSYALTIKFYLQNATQLTTVSLILERTR
jgi:phage baseplate assembly protein W